MLIDLSSLESDNGHYKVPRSASWRIAAATGLVVLLSLSVLACSSGSRPEQPQAPPAPKEASAPPPEHHGTSRGKTIETRKVAISQ